MSTPEINPEKAAKVFADDRANVFHSWSAQAQISPMPIAGASGSYFWDFSGKKYLDFSMPPASVGTAFYKDLQSVKFCGIST